MLNPGLVILDKCMPDMDGMAVLRHIRSDAKSHSVPVVFYSADANTADVEQARRLGAQDYIVKGVTSWDDICSIVARYG